MDHLSTKLTIRKYIKAHSKSYDFIFSTIPIMAMCSLGFIETIKLEEAIEGIEGINVYGAEGAMVLESFAPFEELRSWRICRSVAHNLSPPISVDL